MTLRSRPNLLLGDKKGRSAWLIKIPLVESIKSLDKYIMFSDN